MSQHEEEVRDVIVVGGGAAGLSAALTLTRARRTTTVIDGGQPRNAPAAGVHGLLGHEGINPADLIARGRAEVGGYGGQIIDDQVIDVARTADSRDGLGGFEVTLRSGNLVRGRRLLIATGLVDELPEVPGVREQWGRGVLHCPFCHGWEVRDQRIGVLATDPMGVHKAMLFRLWSNDVVLFTGEQALDEAQRAQMEALDVTLVEGAIVGLAVDGDMLRGVHVVNRTSRASGGTEVVEVDAVVVSTRMVVRAEPFAGIGIELTDHPMGAFIEANEFGQTVVEGVWAAGNASSLGAQVSNAAAEGARAAQHIVADFMKANLESAMASHADNDARGAISAPVDVTADTNTNADVGTDTGAGTDAGTRTDTGNDNEKGHA